MAFLHHQHGVADFRGLNGGAPPGGATADDNEVVDIQGPGLSCLWARLAMQNMRRGRLQEKPGRGGGYGRKIGGFWWEFRRRQV
jgi:hypothetical protein